MASNPPRSAAKEQAIEDIPNNQTLASPRQPLSNRHSPLNTGEDSDHDPLQHESPNESVSSSVLATPHQPVLDRFDSYDMQGLKRDSADSGDELQPQSQTDVAKKVPVCHSTAVSITEVIDLDQVCPLDNSPSAKSPTSSTRSEPKSPTSPIEQFSTSPLKSKLSLIPSAIGYAAGLLPTVRSTSTSTSNVEPVSIPKSASSSGSMNKGDVGSPASRGAAQLSAGSDTSSIHSATSPSLDVKDEPTVPAPGPSSWRSLTSFLVRAPNQPVQDSATTPTPRKSTRPATEAARNIDTETPSTSFLLHHITSPSATADRRRSLELGGPQQLREGFERVKAEMVSAAKELREKDAKSKRDSGMVGASALSPLSETSELANDAEGGVIDSVDWRKSFIHGLKP